MRFSRLIWDFDGTLFDTYPPLVSAIERALGDFNVSVPRAAIRQMLRGTLSGTIAKLVSAHELQADVFEARINSYHAQANVRENRPFPGAIQLLERILAAGGQNYLVTHRDLESLSAMLTWYRVDGLFADMITSDDDLPRKPDPTAFNAMIARHSLLRDQVLVVGDRDLDIQAGRAAHVHTCLYDALPSPGVLPDFIIRTFAELEVILQFAPSP